MDPTSLCPVPIQEVKEEDQRLHLQVRAKEIVSISIIIIEDLIQDIRQVMAEGVVLTAATMGHIHITLIKVAVVVVATTTITLLPLISTRVTPTILQVPDLVQHPCKEAPEVGGMAIIHLIIILILVMEEDTTHLLVVLILEVRDIIILIINHIHHLLIPIKVVTKIHGVLNVNGNPILLMIQDLPTDNSHLLHLEGVTVALLDTLHHNLGKNLILLFANVEIEE